MNINKWVLFLPLLGFHPNLVAANEELDCPNCPCIADIAYHFFEAPIGSKFSSNKCVIHNLSGDLGEGYHLSFDLYHKKYRSESLQENCKRTWDYLIEQIRICERNICGNPENAADEKEQELFRRCNADQDILNTIFSETYEGKPPAEEVKVCPSGVKMRAPWILTFGRKMLSSSKDTGCLKSSTLGG